MFRGILLFVVMITAFCTHVVGQKGVSPAGCFQNLIEVHGDIFGFGVIKIWKKQRGYAGTFSERRSELGEHYEAIPLRKIRYDLTKRVVRFDITFNNMFNQKTYVRRDTRGIVTRRGIRLDVGKKIRAIYNGPNPFFSRKFSDCF